MRLFPAIALSLGLYESVLYAVRLGKRRSMFVEARAAADVAGKPLLVVGAPRAWYQPVEMYPHGDVTCDLVPTDAQTQQCNAEHLQYEDKQFGALFAPYVLEYVSDPRGAYEEFQRIADKVFVLTLRPYELATWMHPGARWRVKSVEPFEVVELPVGGTAALALTGATLAAGSLYGWRG